MANFFMVLLFLTALFLILLVLVQRGKGGGLAGAFGGMGGQSAFGTKAGDTFTRITIGVATVWILLCVLSVRFLGSSEDRMNLGEEPAPVQGGSMAPAPGGEPAAEEASGGAGDAPGDDSGDDGS